MPPTTLTTLVNDYNDGILLNYLDPRELARSFSPLPWALRSTAPTDHNLAQKVVDTENDSSKPFTLPKYLNEKHQIALDASGLEMNQQYYDFGWDKMQRNKMSVLIVFVIGLTLCSWAAILNNTPLLAPLTDLPALPVEVEVTTKVDIDEKNKQGLLSFMNEADNSIRSEQVTPKKAVLCDFINDDNIADSTGDKSDSSVSIQPIPLGKKIVEDTSTPNNQMPKSDSVKQPVVTEHATLKKEGTDTPSSENMKAKQKPNILRTVKRMIRSAICAIISKSGMKCEYDVME